MTQKNRTSELMARIEKLLEAVSGGRASVRCHDSMEEYFRSHCVGCARRNRALEDRSLIRKRSQNLLRRFGPSASARILAFISIGMERLVSKTFG
jgi:hypothetical protein